MCVPSLAKIKWLLDEGYITPEMEYHLVCEYIFYTGKRNEK